MQPCLRHVSNLLAHVMCFSETPFVCRLQRMGASEGAQKYVGELLARQWERYRHNLVQEGEKRRELLDHMKSLEVRLLFMRFSAPCLPHGACVRRRGSDVAWC